MDVRHFPEINAGLNGISAVLLVAGYVLIRRRRVKAHQACMLAAFLTSVAFLACYLVYHAQVGHVSYAGTGVARTVYLSILVSHIVLAILVPPLALVTLFQAFRSRFDRHRRTARWTLPVWLYVSVTGVIVYFMLYG